MQDDKDKKPIWQPTRKKDHDSVIEKKSITPTEPTKPPSVEPPPPPPGQDKKKDD